MGVLEINLLDWQKWYGTEEACAQALTLTKQQYKTRVAMGHRDSIYRLHDLVEIDDALVSGRRSGKRGRGVKGKAPILVAIEDQSKCAGLIAMQQVSAVTHETLVTRPPTHTPVEPVAELIEILLHIWTIRRNKYPTEML